MTDKCEHRTCHCPARMDSEYVDWHNVVFYSLL